METYENVETLLRRAVNAAREHLMKYNSIEDFDRAAEILEALKTVQIDVAVLTAYQKVERWRNHHESRRDSIYDACREAEDVTRAHPDAYFPLWCLGYARKYCHEHALSLQSYDAAYQAAPQAMKRMVEVERAETHVYMDQIDDALALIGKPVNTDPPWTRWILGFALHQRARRGDHGEKLRLYDQAIAELNQCVNVHTDVYLLIAACHGGRFRVYTEMGEVGDASRARGDAETAMRAFLAGAPDWTIKREKRGPFAKKPKPNGRAANPHGQHFYKNLRVTRLLPESRDGDGDPVHDPDNDDEDE